MTQRVIHGDHLYFVTTTTTERQQFFKNKDLAVRLSQVIFKACDLKRFDLFAYAILPDHVHLLIKPVWRSLEKLRCERGELTMKLRPNPQRTFSKVRDGESRNPSYTISNLMQSIKGTFSRQLHKGRFWQPHFNFRIVGSDDRLYNTVEYIRYNFQKHNLSKRYGHSPHQFVDWKKLQNVQ